MFTIGSLLIILALTLLLYQRYALQKEKLFSNISSLIENDTSGKSDVDDNSAQVDINTGYIDNDDVDHGNDDVIITDKDINDSKSDKKEKEYIGYLEIPKINLKYGFVSMNSYYNNVNRNIQVLTISDYPDVTNGNLIIAGHSGNSEVSYFALLFRLSVGDKANVIYKGKTYTYKITSIYKEKKDGAVNIKRDVNKTTLTLITCSYKDRQNQTIYIAELESVKNGGTKWIM